MRGAASGSGARPRKPLSGSGGVPAVAREGRQFTAPRPGGRSTHTLRKILPRMVCAVIVRLPSVLHRGTSDEDGLTSQVGIGSVTTRSIFQWHSLENAMRGRAERRNGIGATGYLDRSSAGARGSGFGDLHLQMTSGTLVHRSLISYYYYCIFFSTGSFRHHIVTGFDPYSDGTCRAKRRHLPLFSNRVPKFGTSVKPPHTRVRQALSANITETPATFGISVGRWR